MLPRFAASVCSTNAVTISRSWWHFCRIVHANGTNVRSATSFVINMLEKKHKKQVPASAARYSLSLPEAGCRSHRTIRCSEILPQSASATAKCRARASQCSPRTAGPGCTQNADTTARTVAIVSTVSFFIKSMIFCNMLSIIFSVPF